MTQIFWNEFLSLFKPFVSPVAVEEIEKTYNARKLRNILKLVENCSVLTENEAVQKIADEYIRHGLLPEKYSGDALHIAYASLHNTNLDKLMSKSNRERDELYHDEPQNHALASWVYHQRKKNPARMRKIKWLTLRAPTAVLIAIVVLHTYGGFHTLRKMEQGKEQILNQKSLTLEQLEILGANVTIQE